MKKLLASSLVFAACISMNAHGGYISGTHTLSNGNTVALQGLEWMPLTYTAGLSRTDIENGFTDRFGTTWAAGEWTYATRAQTETLLKSLWDQSYYGWSNGNASGAHWFLEKFGGIAFDLGYGVSRIEKTWSSSTLTNFDYSFFFYGDTASCYPATNISCYGHVAKFDNDTQAKSELNATTLINELSYVGNSGAGGWFYGSYGLDQNSISPHWESTELVHPAAASLLVRQQVNQQPSQVSAPTSLSVLALGLLGLMSLRRRPKNQ